MKQNFSTISSRRMRNRAFREDVPSAIRSIAMPQPRLWSDDDDAHDECAHRFPAWKRCLDFLAIMISMPLWLPLMIVGVLVVKIVSRGPVFFRQERVGLGGRRFMILKFRTMHFNADTSGHENYFEKLIKSDRPMTKLDAVGDKRLIRGGRLLRATALDELPQLFNVLRGEMSLVGPRPCTPAEMAHYDERQMERFNCPPGLTGFWQVNGKNKTTFSEMIDMDVRYGREMSAWGDIRIMLKTFPVLVEQVAELRRKRALDKIEQAQSVAPADKR